MEYGQDPKSSVCRRLTSGSLGQSVREPPRGLAATDDRASRVPSVDRNLNYTSRSCLSSIKTRRTGGDLSASQQTKQAAHQRLPPPCPTTRRESDISRGVRFRSARPSGGLQTDYRRYSDSNTLNAERGSANEGSSYQRNTSHSVASVSRSTSAACPLSRGDLENTSPRTSVEEQRSGRVGTSALGRRASLQFYYDPGKYSAPSSEKDLIGVRSVYTSRLGQANDVIYGSGRRAVVTPSSTYRPLVYTPGSPSPLRRSWTGPTAPTQPDSMASFMAIGRNAVFPDLRSPRGSSGQHGTATPAYQENAHETGLEALKQKTLRLFGNNNNSQKNSGSSSGKSTSSPTSSSKCFYRSNSQSSSGEHKSNSGSSNGNGGSSRNIYRQPSSISNHRSGSAARNQNADLRRKYFSQRMMWYSEADEDHIEPELDRDFEKRHHSALELDSMSHSDLLRSDSLQSSSTASSQESIEPERVQGMRRARAAVLKSQSLDYYDNLDYRETHGYRETISPGSLRVRRASGSGSGSSLRLNSRAGTLQRQRSKTQRTRFSDEVAVVYYDQEENPTALSKCDTIHEQEKLKDDKASSSTVTEGTVRLACTLHPGQSCGQSNLARILATTASLTQTQDTQNDNNDKNTTTTTSSTTTTPMAAFEFDKMAALAVTDNIDTEGNMIRKSVFADKTFEIVAQEEGAHELKLVVPIGPQFIRNRTSVKATSGGKRLIVIAYRNEGEAELAHVHLYIEKMTLPHPIDAYSVRATMDREGNLKISAPMLIEPNDVTVKATGDR